MFLEQEIINKIAQREVENLVFNGETVKQLDFDEIHDASLFVEINGERVEDNDILYRIILSIINNQSVIDEINNKIKYLYENGIVL